MELMRPITALIIILLTAVATPLPQPFNRVLRFTTPPTQGKDVTILQQLLHRAPNCMPPPLSGAFDNSTRSSLRCFQRQHTNLSPSGDLDLETAWQVLTTLAEDQWQDDGRSAAELGDYKFKIILPLHHNRSIETQATLLDAQNRVLLHFPARAHGHDVDANGQAITGVPWPDLSDDGCSNSSARQGCIGLNSFSRFGSTPTGLVALDLNSPEDDPMLYGPYPVLRFVHGLVPEANTNAFLYPTIRDGILLHSGQWANHSSWRPGQPMPNSGRGLTY